MGFFFTFFNCTNGTKSRNASQFFRFAELRFRIEKKLHVKSDIVSRGGGGVSQVVLHGE